MNLSDLAGQPLTYPGAGGTLTSTVPPEYRRIGATGFIGHGERAFGRAAEALLAFDMHRRAGLRMQSSAERAAPGVDALGRLGAGPLTIDVPCRVVWATEPGAVVAAGSRWAGFGYGTLPGHPASGEEAFLVELVDGRVLFTVRAFSRPAILPMRLAGPLAPRVQHLGALHYIRTLRTLAAG